MSRSLSGVKGTQKKRVQEYKKSGSGPGLGKQYYFLKIKGQKWMYVSLYQSYDGIKHLLKYWCHFSKINWITSQLMFFFSFRDVNSMLKLISKIWIHFHYSLFNDNKISELFTGRYFCTSFWRINAFTGTLPKLYRPTGCDLTHLFVFYSSFH